MLDRARAWSIFGWLGFLFFVVVAIFMLANQENFYQMSLKFNTSLAQQYPSSVPAESPDQIQSETTTGTYNTIGIAAIPGFLVMLTGALMAWRNYAGYRTTQWRDAMLQQEIRQAEALEFLAGKKQATMMKPKKTEVSQTEVSQLAAAAARLD